MIKNMNEVIDFFMLCFEHKPVFNKNFYTDFKRLRWVLVIKNDNGYFEEKFLRLGSIRTTPSIYKDIIKKCISVCNDEEKFNQFFSSEEEFLYFKNYVEKIKNLKAFL